MHNLESNLIVFETLNFFRLFENQLGFEFLQEFQIDIKSEFKQILGQIEALFEEYYKYLQKWFDDLENNFEAGNTEIVEDRIAQNFYNQIGLTLALFNSIDRVSELQLFMKEQFFKID